MLAGTAAEGIEVGDQMAEIAVGVHEVADFRTRRAAGAMREAELVGREDERPALVDRTWITAVLAVQGVHVLGVLARDEVEHAQPFRNGSASLCREPQGPTVVNAPRRVPRTTPLQEVPYER